MVVVLLEDLKILVSILILLMIGTNIEMKDIKKLQKLKNNYIYYVETRY